MAITATTRVFNESSASKAFTSVSVQIPHGEVNNAEISTTKYNSNLNVKFETAEQAKEFALSILGSVLNAETID